MTTPHTKQDAEQNAAQNPAALPLAERRERVFFLLAAVFICAMTLLNVIGITRFVQLGPIQLALGVLPYPLTFLCTDLICELYGRARANFVVSVGLLLNLLIIGFLWLGQQLPAVAPDSMPSWQMIQLAENIRLPSGSIATEQIELFQLIYQCSAGAVFASMIAYIAAQYADVRLFHFFKRLTAGKHLWLRNNCSTAISQAIDSFIVIGITFSAAYFAGEISLAILLTLMASNYLFKLLAALLDTLPLYWLVGKLSRYLQIDHRVVK